MPSKHIKKHWLFFFLLTSRSVTHSAWRRGIKKKNLSDHSCGVRWVRLPTFRAPARPQGWSLKGGIIYVWVIFGCINIHQNYELAINRRTIKTSRHIYVNPPVNLYVVSGFVVCVFDGGSGADSLVEFVAFVGGIGAKHMWVRKGKHILCVVLP